jgi:putative iron-dependent peroxidase
VENCQPGILAPVPRFGRYLSFSLKAGADPRKSLGELAKIADGKNAVIGIGASTIQLLGKKISGLKPFPTNFAAGLLLASHPAALWCWLRGDDRGDLLHASNKIAEAVTAFFSPRRRHRFVQPRRRTGSHRLRRRHGESPGSEGYRCGDRARTGDGLDGASFVAVQLWVHDFKAFNAMSGTDQDNAIGRRKSDNEELADAPESSHVKRTAQESFDPEAFVLRRSMPWAEGMRGGLNFVAFGKSLDAFEAQLKRMVGAEDGITDALFKFTLPVSGSYFWCPPMRGAQLDLRALGF